MAMAGPGRGRTEVAEPVEEVGVKWVIGPNVRADILGYAGVDITGAQFIAQIYASGFRRGTLEGDRLKSIVIGAPYGTRIILCSTTDEVNWEDAPWRCIRILEGQTYHTGEGVPAVRVPDIDWLDGFDQRRTASAGQASYPIVRRLAEGTTWTFGTGASLHNKVRMIRVEREDRPIATDGAVLATTAAPLSPTEEIVPDAPAPAAPAAPEIPAAVRNAGSGEDQWRLPKKG